jgi:hypothetical protein
MQTSTGRPSIRMVSSNSGDKLNPADILEGAAVPHHPKLYVLGCFDKRITFYSQQVRALSLVHALHELKYLRGVENIAVIGAGAAGLTASAAVALATTGQVVLFEASPELLPIQMGTSRRKLDPHIYDWPRVNTTDKAANLPILDWESGPSREVRKDVINEFKQIVTRTNGRMQQRLSCKVTLIERVEKSYKVTYDCLEATGVNLPRENRSEQFDMVFLAVGFGLEPKESIAGIRGVSYWSDGGVPNSEFEARKTPRYFISGNGDGGLIDFVAAASADFDHGTMIQMIVDHAGMERVEAVLGDIDMRARLVPPDLPPFNLFDAYDREVTPLIEANGLLIRMAAQLRRGVQLVLQTHQPEIFSIDTSTLNRLAVFATIKACELATQSSFRHIHCSKVEKGPPGEMGVVVLDCEVEQLEVDEVIIRRGPNRDSVREPFVNIIGEYEAAHIGWLKRYGEATLVPSLSDEARAFFAARAFAAELPLSKRLQRQANVPVSFKLRAMGTIIHWTGALAKRDIADIWTSKYRYNLILPDTASALGEVANAILRIASHCQNLTIYADPAHWDHLARETLTCGTGLQPIDFGDDAPSGATERPGEFSTAGLANELHACLDGWMLAKINAHLDSYLTYGTESDSAIGMTIASDLRALMKTTWNEWRTSFAAAPELLKHFLHLMMSASEVDHDIRHVLVGPRKLPDIVRGVVVSLAIASSWKATAPKDGRPGNLRRELGGASDWSGHSFADNRLNGQATVLHAGNFMWQTDFVILAVEGAIEVTRNADATFRQDVADQPAFNVPFGHEPVVMSISGGFQQAVKAGVDELAELLARAEAARLARWTNALDIKDAA